MSDWNTLHLFDSKRFYGKVVPEIRNDGQIIDNYLRSKLYRFITHIEHIEDKILDKIRSFSKKFDDSFKIYFELQEIQNVKKGIGENYQEFIKKKNGEIEQFYRKYSEEIYHFSTVLPLIVFSECAQFNPHLILGRKIFRSNISANKNTIAEECCNKILETEIGGISHSDTGHIINWLTHQEVKMLWMDIENLNVSNQASDQYYRDFINFLKIAIDNELGFISISNVREDILKMIETSHLNVKIDLKEKEFINVIRYK